MRRARHQHPPGRRINSGLGGGPECKEAHGQANWKMRVQLPARTPAGRATHLLERPQVLARQVRKALQSARQGGETHGNAGVQTGWLSSYGQNRPSRQPQLSHRRRRRPSAHRRSARTRTACTRRCRVPVAAALSPLPLHAGVVSRVRRRPLQKKHLAGMPLAHQQCPLLAVPFFESQTQAPAATSSARSLQWCAASCLRSACSRAEGCHTQLLVDGPHHAELIAPAFAAEPVLLPIWRGRNPPRRAERYREEAAAHTCEARQAVGVPLQHTARVSDLGPPRRAWHASTIGVRSLRRTSFCSVSARRCCLFRARVGHTSNKMPPVPTDGAPTGESSVVHPPPPRVAPP